MSSNRRFSPQITVKSKSNLYKIHTPFKYPQSKLIHCKNRTTPTSPSSKKAISFSNQIYRNFNSWCNSFKVTKRSIQRSYQWLIKPANILVHIEENISTPKKYAGAWRNNLNHIWMRLMKFFKWLMANRVQQHCRDQLGRFLQSLNSKLSISPSTINDYNIFIQSFYPYSKYSMLI